MKNITSINSSVKTTKKNYSFKNICLISIFYSILSIGCIFQILSMYYLFYSYPTIVSTETQFEVHEEELPAITICGIYKNKSTTNSLNELFRSINIRNIIKKSVIKLHNSVESEITDKILDSVFASINSLYYCFTINSRIKCKFDFKYTRFFNSIKEFF
jgi:hypothetical protein